ncbi:cupin-like domain-containing protein [Chromobacterium alkanivorans]|uniref:cupin-like domain-containing protein n=1 Tax=Chromobacterium alkanivorans TaxID=1071719 RepID=UPI001966DF5D|nr:cupin-like domain-containing protein [Chromobacterium alkanivorans]MBN3003485.1 cupin-like domain-containing protein [Chromobacterium alkanivorans]
MQNAPILIEENILKRRDVASIDIVENAFSNGPVAEALRQAPSIERRKGLSKEAFDREYRAGQRPVILEGYAADWPAVRNWSFERLAQRCGDTPVVVNSYSSQRSAQASFAEFVAMMMNNEGPDTQPIYLQEWYYKASRPELAADLPEMDIAQYDFRRDLYGEVISTNHQLWLGQRGGVTRLHQDSYTIDVMHVQLVGEKHWIVMGPEAKLAETADGGADLAALAQDPATQLMQCTLKPGDVLYLPALWFHRIKLLSNSIGLGRKCLDQANLQIHIRQRMAELLALALNPEEVKLTHPELFNVVMMRNRVWAKRMGIDLSKLRP